MRSLIPLVLFVLFTVSCADAQKTDRAALREELRAILKEHPELILEVLREQRIPLYEIVEQGAAAKQAAEDKRRMEAELANPLDPGLDPARPVLGPLDAPFTVAEYSDFLCPYCGIAAETMHELVKKYPGKIRLQFKHFPRSENGLTLARVHEAVGMQDHAAAWTFHDEVFAKQEALQRDFAPTLDAILDGLSASHSIDLERLAADLQNPDVLARIEKDTAEAQKFGFRGTPSFVVGGVSVRGSWPLAKYEDVLKQVAAARAARGETTGTCLDCPDSK